MLFNSVQFFSFFIVVYVLYVCLEHRWQNRMLLAASLYFYGSWSWKFLILLAISIVVDYSVAIGLDRLESPGHRKLLLTISVTNGLVLLGFFKYYNFFADNLATALSRVGVDAHLLHLDV